MTQTEKIVWHKYPDDNPPLPDMLFDVFDQPMKRKKNYLVGCFSPGRMHIVEWNGHHFKDINEGGIYAWAEMPKGWQV